MFLFNQNQTNSDFKNKYTVSDDDRKWRVDVAHPLVKLAKSLQILQ